MSNLTVRNPSAVCGKFVVSAKKRNSIPLIPLYSSEKNTFHQTKPNSFPPETCQDLKPEVLKVEQLTGLVGGKFENRGTPGWTTFGKISGEFLTFNVLKEDQPKKWFGGKNLGTFEKTRGIFVVS
jgi:hypothetical protein